MKTLCVVRKVRLLLLLLLSMTAFFSTISISSASIYIIEQLTSNGYNDERPQINDNRYVAWGTRNGTYDNGTYDWEIYLYNGTTTNPPSVGSATHSVYLDFYPSLRLDINNNGEVVWCGLQGNAGTTYRDFEIFLSDGITTTQITSNGGLYDDLVPKINDNGHVVWYGHTRSGYSPAPTSYEIYLYDGTVTNPPSIGSTNYATWSNTIIPTHCPLPQINNNGHVVWYGLPDDEEDTEVFLYDGTTTNQITDNGYDDERPQINDNGHVVWSGRPDNQDLEIFLYDGTTTNQITDNGYDDERPQINDNGHVVWLGRHAGQDLEIFLYDGTTITQITSNGYDDYAPNINDRGHVYWSDGQEIYFSNGTTTNPPPIITPGHSFRGLQINNKGDLVWRGWDSVGSDYDIFLAYTRPFISRPSHLLEMPVDGVWDDPFSSVQRPREDEYPYSCPEHSFSKIWHPSKMPSHLYRLNQMRNDMFVRKNSQVPQKGIERMIALYKTIPSGQRFNESMKNSVINELQDIKGTTQDARSVSGKLLEAMNAIELDWRVPSLSPKKVKKGMGTTVDFRGVAWVTFKNTRFANIVSETISLKVEGGVPALVRGFDPGWPIASCQFDFTGELTDYADISFYLGGRTFRGDPSTLSIFQWDGKTYKDITTTVDLPRKVIRGRTDKLSTFVIMSHLDGSKEKQK